jgi:primosomal protein N' (replication factor Y)
LTWHARGQRLLCHYCGWKQERPARCPGCGGVKFLQPGRGTQKAETELATRLPGARVLRMDLDTTAGVAGHERVLGAFARGEADILLGTQMVAKGHHYPNVTVVGVISADAGLNFPDFRAAERTYQLLSQAAGRTGRGEAGGAVYVQTYTPDHYLFEHLVGHDFPGFALRELRLREELRYPPAGRLILVTVSAPSAEGAREAGERAAAAMAAAGIVPEADVLGPAPALIGRLRGRHRVQILVRGGPDAAGKRALVVAARDAASSPGIEVQWDVDPIDIF